MKNKLAFALICASPAIFVTVESILAYVAHHARQKELQVQIDARNYATHAVMHRLLKDGSMTSEDMEQEFEFARMTYYIEN